MHCVALSQSMYEVALADAAPEAELIDIVGPRHCAPVNRRPKVWFAPPVSASRALLLTSGKLMLGTWPTKLGFVDIGIGSVYGLLYGTNACAGHSNQLYEVMAGRCHIYANASSLQRRFMVQSHLPAACNRHTRQAASGSSTE